MDRWVSPKAIKTSHPTTLGFVMYGHVTQSPPTEPLHKTVGSGETAAYSYRWGLIKNHVWGKDIDIERSKDEVGKENPNATQVTDSYRVIVKAGFTSTLGYRIQSILDHAQTRSI